MSKWDGLDRRKFPRANYPCLIIIRHGQATPEALLTHTENIGIGGVCVILKKNLKLFMPIELEIDLLDTSSHLRCKGKIVWCIKRSSTEKKKPSFYDTGIEFTGIKDEAVKRIEGIISHLMGAQKADSQK